MDDEKESIKDTRQMIKNSLGLDTETQEIVENLVIGSINTTKTIFEGMAVLLDNEMDPKSIFAGTILGTLTAPMKTKVCVAVPVDLIDQMLGMFDTGENDKIGKDDAQLSEQELAEIEEMLRKDDIKVAD